MSEKNQLTGVFLINLGTTDSPAIKDVRRYLREFLMDERVMDIPFWKRFLLINLIIAPFRAPQSAKAYQQLWTPEGSPLKIYGHQLKFLLQKSLGAEYFVEFGMRYQNPSIKNTLNEFEKRHIKNLIIIPLYPQYASASTGSTIEEILKQVKKWEVLPHMHIINKFANNPLFIKCFADIGRKYLNQFSYDHVLFSYHGLPERQIKKASFHDYCQLNNKCCSSYHGKNQYCYRAQCFETTRLLVKELGLSKDQYTVCFQSRLGKTPWIQPYTDNIIPTLPKQGKKSVLVFSPSFIADCLETTVEIGIEYKHLFQEAGGERWDLVESLNTEPLWVECLKQMILGHEPPVIKDKNYELSSHQ